MWFLALAALSIILVTAVPLRLDFALSSTRGFDSYLIFTWGGFIRVRTALGSLRRNNDALARHEVRPKRSAKKAKSRIPPSLYSHSTVSYVIDCVRRLSRQTQIGPMQVALRFGCDNPADTGILFASLVPLQLLLSGTRAQLTFEPCFWGECFEPRGQGQLTLVPIRYLGVLSAIALSPRTWQLAFRLLRESKPG